MALVCLREIRCVRGSYFSFAVLAIDPSSVQQPNIRLVLVDLLLQQFGVQGGVSCKEDFSETSRESGRGGVIPGNDSCHVGGVTADKVIHSLGGVELGNWRKYSVSITSQKDDVLGVASDCRELRSWNVFQWV